MSLRNKTENSFSYNFYPRYFQSLLSKLLSRLPEVVLLVFLFMILEWYYSIDSIFANIGAVILFIIVFAYFFIITLEFMLIAFLAMLGFAGILGIGLFIYGLITNPSFYFSNPSFEQFFIIIGFLALGIAALYYANNLLPPRQFKAILSREKAISLSTMDEVHDLSNCKKIIIRKSKGTIYKNKLFGKGSYPVDVIYWNITIDFEYESNLAVLNTTYFEDKKEAWFGISHQYSFYWVRRFAYWLGKMLQVPIEDHSGSFVIHYDTDSNYHVLNQKKIGDGLFGFQAISKFISTFNQGSTLDGMDYDYYQEAIRNGYRTVLKPKYQPTKMIRLAKYLEYALLSLIPLTFLAIIDLERKGLEYESNTFYILLFSMLLFVLYLLAKNRRYLELIVTPKTTKLREKTLGIVFTSKRIDFSKVVGVHIFDRKLEIVATDTEITFPGNFETNKGKILADRLLNIFQIVASYSEITNYEYEILRCLNCNEEIQASTTVCNNCQSSAPTCIICFGATTDKEQIVSYQCCDSYAHLSHAKHWNDRKSFCPYCKRDKPVLKPVIIQSYWFISQISSFQIISFNYDRP